jgi:hypothetical protein
MSIHIMGYLVDFIIRMRNAYYHRTKYPFWHQVSKGFVISNKECRNYDIPYFYRLFALLNHSNVAFA